MKTALLAAAAITTLGLAACQPAADETATSATDSAANTSAMAPADGSMSGSTTTTPGSTMDSTGSMTSTPGSTMGSTPGSTMSGQAGSSGMMNPDGTMSNGAVNPASPPPVTAPERTGGMTTPPSQ